MFSQELTRIMDTLKASVAKTAQLKKHCDVIEDMVDLQNQLPRYGLVAFVGDGAILPRQSGVSQAPLKEGAVAFHSPDQMAVEVEFINAGRRRGLGIRPGVNVLIGAGFHGKSTLLDALAKGVYPHIPGDGRERVITHPDEDHYLGFKPLCANRIVSAIRKNLGIAADGGASRSGSGIGGGTP